MLLATREAAGAERRRIAVGPPSSLAIVSWFTRLSSVEQYPGASRDSMGRLASKPGPCVDKYRIRVTEPSPFPTTSAFRVGSGHARNASIREHMSETTQFYGRLLTTAWIFSPPSREFSQAGSSSAPFRAAHRSRDMNTMLEEPPPPWGRCSRLGSPAGGVRTESNPGSHRRGGRRIRCLVESVRQRERSGTCRTVCGRRTVAAS